MAQKSGLSHTTISRIWRAFALQPHRTETFKLSADPLFVEKVRDIVGLYLNPPDRALVLCVDEKSQIQALDRTRPLLPVCAGNHFHTCPLSVRGSSTPSRTTWRNTRWVHPRSREEVGRLRCGRVCRRGESDSSWRYAVFLKPGPGEWPVGGGGAVPPPSCLLVGRLHPLFTIAWSEILCSLDLFIFFLLFPDFLGPLYQAFHVGYGIFPVSLKLCYPGLSLLELVELPSVVLRVGIRRYF